MPDFTRKLTILSCLLFTGFCFWKAAAGLFDVTDASVVSTAEAAMSPSYAHKRGITTPIQDMRPGMRIVGRNPNRLETEATIDPTPEGWRLLSVRMLKQDGSYFEAELLRPLGWIHQHRAKPGATIQLNMSELRVVGAAEVLSISDCPPIDPGDGPVVVSTFKNVSRNVLNIYVEGEETPIGVTAGHPIWSEDRQAFVHSEKLQIGEKLRSALGRTVRITSIEPRAGPEAVYNLEVAGEHVYSVTNCGLLVHNTGPCDLNAAEGGAFSIVGRSGSNPRSVDWFNQAAVLDDMAASPIGRQILDAAESHVFRLEFSSSYLRKSRLANAREFTNVGGRAMKYKAKVFLPAVGSNSRAATTAIHEGVHMLGVRGSRRAEALARLAEISHRGGSIDRAAMRRVLGDIKNAHVEGIGNPYKEFPWRQGKPGIGRTSPHFPGLEF